MGRVLVLVGAISISLAMPGGNDAQGGTVTREELLQTVQKLSHEVDLFAATEFVLGLGEDTTVVKAFANLVRDCYWKSKSVEQVLHFANSGINFCLARAIVRDADDKGAAQALRYAAKKMATDAASHTWIGWEEPGITISPEQMKQGLAMAKYSVRQLHELEPTAKQLAFTYWFLAAHLIAQDEYEEAHTILTKAREYSIADGDDQDGLTMLEGYVALTKLLMGKKESGESEFGMAVSTLEARGNEDAKFYAEQLKSVRDFFENQ